MIKINNNEYLWVEKYRPQTVSDLIMPNEIKSKLLEWIKDGQIPNIGLFSNTPGTGKTTTSKAITNDLDADIMFLNGSKENGIDIIRNKVTGFVSSVSFEGKPKIVIYDEADGISSSGQESFRGFIEEYTQNARFILTGNYANKIIEPVLNRLVIIDFDALFSKNKAELAKQCFERLCFVLDNEKVQYNKEDLKPVVTSFYPSVRKMINVLQESVVQGTLNINKTTLETTAIYDGIIQNIRDKKFDKCRALISDLHNPHAFYNYVYKNCNRIFQEESIPTVIMATHHFMSANVNARDPEISLAAYCATLMRNVEIKFKDNQ